MSVSKKYGSVAGVAGALAVCAVAVVGCGARFGSLDCKETRTCVPSDDTASAGEGGASAGTSAGTSGDAPQSEGGAAGVSATEAECQSATDCSNRDPSDGEELCFSGTCMAGNPPPRVVSITPLEGADKVEPDSAVVIEFNEALDEETVTSENIKISSGNETVAGVLEYADNKVTFTPSAPFALGRAVRILVTSGVTDEGGASLLKELESSFDVRDGAWKSTDAVKDQVNHLSPQLPITRAGAALVAWNGSHGEACPASARWFARGAALTPLVTFSDTSGSCSSLTSASNDDGVAAVAWSSSMPKAGSYARLFRDGKWQEKSALVSVAKVGSSLQASVTPNGTGLLFEVDGTSSQKVWHTVADDAWAPKPALLSPGIPGYQHASIAFDADGNGLTVWQGTLKQVDTIRVATYTADTGAFSSGVELGTGHPEGGDPMIAVTPGGEAVAVWYKGDHIEASYFSGKSWTKPETISGNLTGFYFSSARGLVYDGRHFIAAWDAVENQASHTYTAMFEATSGWTVPEERQSVDDGAQEAGSTRLASDGHGTTLVIWASRTGVTTGHWVAQRYRDDAWQPSAPIAGAEVTGASFGSAALGMNSSGVAALAWENRDAENGTVGIALASFY
jgi:hypothetical protein